jgi:subtilisin family serine protease
MPRHRWLWVVLLASAVVAGMAISSPASADEADILHAGGATAVADSYIVVLKSSAVTADGVDSLAQGLAARHGGGVGQVYRHALRGFEVSLPEAAARRLGAHPAVSYIQQNHTVSIAATQSPTPSWGLDRIDQRNLPLDNSYTFPTTAPEVRVYVIDTGIRFTHQDFGGRAVSGRDTIDNDNDATDCHGHGTHVSGTVGGTSFGVAKQVTLVGVRVLNCAGSGTFAQVIAGIDWVTGDHDPGELAVANMSLGGGFDQATNDAVTASIADGVTYAVAAGNENTNACTRSPASTPNAITLGATSITDARASFSNFGTCLDLFAPGVSIVSAWITSDTATATLSGTSMASPHAAGVAALILSANPTFTPQQVRDRMVADATPGVVTSPGTGSPNLLLFVDNGGTPPPACTGTNGTNVTIPDQGTADSPITISGCTGNASATSTVEVHIVHSRIGELVVSLIAPDGSVYVLHNQTGGNANNINQTYTVNLSSEARNGTWTLRVQDTRRRQTGIIDSWTVGL